MAEGALVTRRGFVGGILAGTLLRKVFPSPQSLSAKWNLYWGDLHNHNAVGYAKGSLARSIEIAQEHLDFFAFTGHAFWHDMPQMPGDRHLKWVRGFEAHQQHWPRTRRLIQEANSKDFAALLGYEWHSSVFGDYCVIFPGDQSQLFLPDHVDKLLDFAEEQKALAIPHHLAYKSGWRGANFSFFRRGSSPVVEIFSEHGCTETDRSPFPMIRHSNGGRFTSNTVIPQLARGLRFGFVASSDDHLGYPGAYGEGLVGVWGEELTPSALHRAIQARRTYAVTGDRILLDVAINDQPMGAELGPEADRQVDVKVEGQDSVAMVELIRNGRVIERHFPEDHFAAVPPGDTAKCRLQLGWGPWAALDMARVCDWDLSIRVEDGRFIGVVPCFQSGPFDEARRDRLRMISEREVELRCFTSRREAFAEDPTKGIVLEVEGPPEARLVLELREPSPHTFHSTLKELREGNRVEFTGVFTSESLIVHRLVEPAEYSARIRWQDNRPGAPADWYYVRVTQQNGQMAWSSPIWVG